jgi:hypothetical protein
VMVAARGAVVESPKVTTVVSARHLTLTDMLEVTTARRNKIRISRSNQHE